MKLATTTLVLICLGSQVFAQDAKQLSVDGLKVVVQSNDGKTVSSNTGKYPAAVLANPQVPPQGSLEVSITVKADGGEFKPQQVMLALKSKKAGVAAYAVGKTKKGAYTLTASAATVEKQLGKQAGEYEVNLLVADPSTTNNINWALGTVEFVFDAANETAAAGVVRTASLQPVSNVKPDIHHVFRQPDKRAPAVISTAFTVLACLPLPVALLYLTGVVGANFKGWPTDATTGLSALLFHGGIGAMLVLYLMFWLKLDLATTLPIALLLGLFVAVTGFKTLSGLATSRLSGPAERAKKDQ